MKCPVCYTKIKHNEYVCPNCGLTLKKEAQARLSSEPVHTKTEHIDEPIHKESKLETIKARYNNLSFYKQQRVIRSVIFCIGLIIFGFITIMGSFNSFVDNTFNNNRYGRFHADEAREILEDDTIIDLGYDHIDNLLSSYDSLSFIKDETIVYEPDIFIFKDKTTFGSIDIEKHKYDENQNQILYRITFDYDHQGTRNHQIYIYGTYDGKYIPACAHINKNDFVTLLQPYSFDGAYDVLEASRRNMLSEVKETYSCYYERNGYTISLDESYSSQYNKTTFQYTIAK